MNFRFACPKLLGPLLAACVFAGAAGAQTYPARVVRIVVPYPAGAGVDIMTRLFTPRLGEKLGQQFIVDNRAGAGGNIGAEVAAHAAPDGYTLLMAPASIAISQSVYKNLRYDLKRDFQAIALVASVPFVLVVHPSLPIKTTRELIALAKAHPGQLTFASAGTGSSSHLIGEMFRMQARINMLHVPYKGIAAIMDTIAGQVSLTFANTLSVLPQVKAGRLRALAITSARRSAAAPGLPPVAESGLPGFEAATWFALLAPAGTPREIVARLNALINEIAQEMREAIAKQGAEPLGGTPEQVAAHITNEVAKWAKVVAASGARAD
ncbi:MAG: tripartite tricarboxylate transporter substrate binding protein [Betaproteobacteria bacterium]|nr:tripartite tricarboxylate transporter substrate binding protein [Betaproteobacteria bacterium]